MARLAVAFLIGIVFGTGIMIAGMADPAKVLNFLDFGAIPAGTWDPSLAFVMGAALLVTAIGYRLVWPAGHPVFAPKFQVPTRRDLDLPLIGGSAVFGIGWGIAGFCPGAAIPALGTGRSEAILFVVALVAGMAIARWLRRLQAPAAPGKPATH